MDIQYQKDAKNIYAKVFQIYFLFNIMLILAISMFATDILSVFTQPQYYDAKAVVPFLCTSTFLVSGYFIVSIGINLTKKVQHTIWITMMAAVTNIILNFILTPSFGAVGASFCIMFANFLIFYLTYMMSQKHYPINYKMGLIVLLMIPSACIIGLTYYFNFSFWVRISLTLIYLSLSFTLIYKNFRDSSEFRKIIGMFSGLKSSGP